jgi:hypothetical protein
MHAGVAWAGLHGIPQPPQFWTSVITFAQKAVGPVPHIE